MSETPRTEAGQDLAADLRSHRKHYHPDADEASQDASAVAAILAIEKQAAALANDRPSGSGLREALTDIIDVLGPDEAAHDGVCDGCQYEMGEALRIARAALSGSSDPEAVGLDVERLAKAMESAEPGLWFERHDDDPALHGREWAARIAAEYARLTEAKPESPA